MTAAALIYLDLAMLRPVIDGVWHLARLSAIPAPGEDITMLCGAVAQAVFAPHADRASHGVPTQCPYCDLQQRRHLGYEVRPSHPGLRPPRSGKP